MITKRYFTRAHRPRTCDDCFDYVMDDNITVYVDDNEPVDTGLVDSQGTPIMSVIEKEPVGFRIR